MKILKRLFLLTIFLAPFFQGLYFYYETFLATVLLMIMLITAIILNKKLVINKGASGIILSLIVALYFMTSIYGVDSGMSIIGFVKMLSYLIFYLLYCQLYTEDLREEGLLAVAYSCTAISTLGIIAYVTGLFYDRLVKNGRLGGTFQYANTFGLFCLISIVILIRKKRKNILDYVGIITIAIALLLTFSRSMIALFAVTIVIIFFIEKKNRLIGLVFIGGIGILFSIIVYQLNLFDIALRMKQVFSAGEWLIRLIYYKDGIDIVKAFPFGTGHLGYFYVQRFFQTGSTYYIKFIHSNIYQIVIDISILGGGLFLALFGVNILGRKLDRLSKLILVIIFVHGLIDFDFEFPYVYWLVLLTIGFDLNKSIEILGRIWIKTVLSSVVMVSYIYFFVATLWCYQGEYKKAYTLYPLYTDAKIAYVMKTPKYSYESFVLCEEIINSNGYLVEAFAYRRDYYYNNKDYEHAINEARKVMALNPLNIKHVEKYSDIVLDYGSALVEEGRLEEAKTYLEEIINLPVYLTELAKNTNTNYNVMHKPNLIMTKTLQYNYGEAYNLKTYISSIINNEEVQNE